MISVCSVKSQYQRLFRDKGEHAVFYQHRGNSQINLDEHPNDRFSMTAGSEWDPELS